MRTYSAKPKDITRNWYVLDASEVPLGRLATAAARLLIGKDKPSFTPHVDGGDFVVIINAGSLVTTGNKAAQKTYYRHSGYPGGLRQKKLAEAAATKPEEVVRHAVRGMLPVNKLRPSRLTRLKIYREAEHTHQAQNPQAISLKEKK